MALQIKGSSQIQDASVSLSKIADISAGKILGRPEAESANYDAESSAPSELAGQDIRRIAELHTDDNVQFNNIQGAAITAASATLSGDLDSSGDVGGVTATISGAASLGSAAIGGAATVGSTLGVVGALNGSSASFSGALDANSLESTLDATIGRDAIITGDMSSATADVSGLAEMGSAAISGAATIGSTLGLTGALTAQSSGSFGGALSALSLASTNDATIGGDANISGEMVSNTASVTALAEVGSLSVAGNGQIDGNLTIDGNLLVKGDTVEVNVQTLQVEDPMIKLGHGSADDSLDLGFYGLYNDGSDKYAGLFRDESDGKFKLFKDLASEPGTTVADVSNNKASLVADIEGDIHYATDVSFQISGDVAGSATFSGDNSPNIAVTIQDDSVQLANIDFFKDEDDMASDSELHVASQKSIKKYVDDQVAAAGQADLEQKDMLMAYNDGNGMKFVKVKEVVQYITATADNYVELDSTKTNGSDYDVAEFDSNFDELSFVFLNGQKLRFSDDDETTNDYYMENDANSDFRKLSCSMIESGDEIEVRYFILS